MCDTFILTAIDLLLLQVREKRFTNSVVVWIAKRDEKSATSFYKSIPSNEHAIALGIVLSNISYRFLLKETTGEKEFVIVGFIEIESLLQSQKMYNHLRNNTLTTEKISKAVEDALIRINVFEKFPMSHALSASTFSKRFKDDITRVACEYAVSEYMGYIMSDR